MASSCPPICSSSCENNISSDHTLCPISHWWSWAEENIKCNFKISRVHITYYYWMYFAGYLWLWVATIGTVNICNISTLDQSEIVFGSIVCSSCQIFRKMKRTIIGQEIKSASRQCDASDYVFLLFKNENEAHSPYIVLNCPCLGETGVQWGCVTQRELLNYYNYYYYDSAVCWWLVILCLFYSTVSHYVPLLSAPLLSLLHRVSRSKVCMHNYLCSELVFIHF